MKKIMFVILIFLIAFVNISARKIEVTRDKTLLKDGPGNFYDTVGVLKIGSVADYIKDSAEDPGWIEIKYNDKKGFISKMALQETRTTSAKSSDPFADLDFDDIDVKKKGQEIAPGSYTAAIKGFAVNYSKKKKFNPMNIDDLYKITEFRASDFAAVKSETKLAFFPNDGELIGVEEGFINQRMSAIGLSASLDVLQQGVVMDRKMTRRLNVIANILNRQTYDYDVQYRVWVLKDPEPVAYSGPGGYVYFSDTLLKLLQDYREIIAIMGHEVGHVALRHGIKDVAVAQARHSAKKAFDDLDTHLDTDDLALSKELETIVDRAREATALVRDDQQEYEADEISVELLKRYKIDKKWLVSALNKVNMAVGSKYPEYNKQIQKRIKKLTGKAPKKTKKKKK